MAFKPKLLFLSSGIAKLPQLAAFFPEFDFQYAPFLSRYVSPFLKYQSDLPPNDVLSTDTFSASTSSTSSALEISPIWQQALPTTPPVSFAAWGRKPTARQAEKLANKLNLPLVRLEDGFLRSVNPGSSNPLSLVLDQTGIYYDASSPSDLEIAIAKTLMPEQIERAACIRLQWCEAGVSKYNHSCDISEERLFELANGKPFVLLMDQTYGDASVQYGQASNSSFEEMLSAALSRPDQALVIIKLHPEVVSGKKQGYLSELIKKTQYARYPQIQVIDWDVHLPSLLRKAAALYTVTSQSGFEGLLHGIPVHTFGMPFYAGWGLTTDKLPAPSRRSKATLPQLIYAALVAYPRYLDPHTKELTQVEQTIAYLKLQRQNRRRFAGPLSAQGFSPNKLSHFKRFTQGGQWSPKKELPENPIEFCWGAQKSAINQSYGNSPQDTKTVVQVEDGFIRSIGLGASLSTPYSWVFDRTGMYYDATRPSDLETYLQNHLFSDVQLDRAKALQHLFTTLGISKYNLDAPIKIKSDTRLSVQSTLEYQIQLAKGVSHPIALVIGQVETDASIRLGSVDIQTNLQLVKAVKDQFPNAFLIYKPHPDVQAGLRKGSQDHTQITALCDAFDTEHTLPDFLAQVDCVHTISSLSGFEALLRDIPVYCYGLPFYAGWGLTTDRHTCSRRTRKLTLPQLVYGALIHYPTYLHPKTGAYCTPEDLCLALDRIRTEQNQFTGITCPLLPRISQELTLRAMQIYHRLRGL
jgi:capsular polysaccharide export protein